MATKVADKLTPDGRADLAIVGGKILDIYYELQRAGEEESARVAWRMWEAYKDLYKES